MASTYLDEMSSKAGFIDLAIAARGRREIAWGQLPEKSPMMSEATDCGIENIAALLWSSGGRRFICLTTMIVDWGTKPSRAMRFLSVGLWISPREKSEQAFEGMQYHLEAIPGARI